MWFTSSQMKIQQRVEIPTSILLMAFTRSKEKTSVNILVSNYTNKNITFNKGEYIWCLEPAIMDDMTIDDSKTYSTYSITLKKMMAEQVQPDIFDPPLSQAKTRHSIKIRYTSQGVWSTICQGWDIYRDHTINRNDHWHWQLWTHITKTISYSNEKLPMGKVRNRKTTHSESHPQQQVKLVSTHNCSHQKETKESN